MANQNKMSSENNTEIKIGAKTKEILLCNQCQKEVPGDQGYVYKGKKGQTIFLCDGCREIVELAFKEETHNPNILGGFVLGLIAAILAGVAWFAVTVVTGYQIGYAAIGVGFVIGYATIWGAGKKRGPLLQIISAAITFISLSASEYFIQSFYIRKYLLEHKDEYPTYDGHWIFLSPFNPDILKDMISPMGLVIWTIGIYFAYSLPKNRSI